MLVFDAIRRWMDRRHTMPHMAERRVRGKGVMKARKKCRQRIARGQFPKKADLERGRLLNTAIWVEPVKTKRPPSLGGRFR